MNKLTCIKTKISRSRNGWSLGRFETFVAENKRFVQLWPALDVCFTYNSVGFTLINKRRGKCLVYALAWTSR